MAVVEIISCDLKRERGRYLRIYKSGDRRVGSYQKKKNKMYKKAPIQTQLLICSIPAERDDAEASYWRNSFFFLNCNEDCIFKNILLKGDPETTKKKFAKPTDAPMLTPKQDKSRQDL